MHGMGIFDTTNPKVPRKKPWKDGVDRRRAIELALREKEKELLHHPIRSTHVWLRQQAPIDGPKRGLGYDWVRVECRLFKEGTLELQQRAPMLRKIISLSHCSAEARNAAAESEVDNKVQAMKFNFRYEEIRYDDPRLHSALLRPASAHTKKCSPEAEFVVMPLSPDAVIDILEDGEGKDGGKEEIVLRAETVTDKTDWVLAIGAHLCRDTSHSKLAASQDKFAGIQKGQSVRRPAVAKGAVASVFDSLERGMEKVKLRRRQFAVASAFRFQKLKQLTADVQRAFRRGQRTTGDSSDEEKDQGAGMLPVDTKTEPQIKSATHVVESQVPDTTTSGTLSNAIRSTHAFRRRRNPPPQPPSQRTVSTSNPVKEEGARAGEENGRHASAGSSQLRLLQAMRPLRLLRPSTARSTSGRLLPADDDSSGWKGGWGAAMPKNTSKVIDTPVRPGSTVRKTPPAAAGHNKKSSAAAAAAADADALEDALRPPRPSVVAQEHAGSGGVAVRTTTGDGSIEAANVDARCRERITYQPPSRVGWDSDSTLGGRARTASPVRRVKKSTG
jgi:hypothetical protein